MDPYFAILDLNILGESSPSHVAASHDIFSNLFSDSSCSRSAPAPSDPNKTVSYDSNNLNPAIWSQNAQDVMLTGETMVAEWLRNPEGPTNYSITSHTSSANQQEIQAGHQEILLDHDLTLIAQLGIELAESFQESATPPELDVIELNDMPPLSNGTEDNNPQPVELNASCDITQPPGNAESMAPQHPCASFRYAQDPFRNKRSGSMCIYNAHRFKQAAGRVLKGSYVCRICREGFGDGDVFGRHERLGKCSKTSYTSKVTEEMVNLAEQLKKGQLSWGDVYDVASRRMFLPKEYYCDGTKCQNPHNPKRRVSEASSTPRIPRKPRRRSKTRPSTLGVQNPPPRAILPRLSPESSSSSNSAESFNTSSGLCSPRTSFSSSSPPSFSAIPFPPIPLSPTVSTTSTDLSVPSMSTLSGSIAVSSVTDSTDPTDIEDDDPTMVLSTVMGEKQQPHRDVQHDMRDVGRWSSNAPLKVTLRIAERQH